MFWLHHNNCELLLLLRHKLSSSLNGCTVACHGPAHDRNLCLEENVLGIKTGEVIVRSLGVAQPVTQEKTSHWKSSATRSSQLCWYRKKGAFSVIHSPAFFSYLLLSCSPWSPSFCTSLLECTSNQDHIKIPTTQCPWTRMKIPLFIKQFDQS